MKDAKGHGSNAHSDGIENAVPGSAYALAKGKRDALDAAVTQHGATLNQFPKGPMGLTPDAVKATPEFKTAKTNFDRAFAALREHNAYMTKNFSAEMKAERAARKR